MPVRPSAVVVNADERIAGRTRLSIARRLLDRTAVDANGCWVFSGPSRGVGYGAIGVGPTVFDTHRLAYLLFVGPLPPRMLVCHTCDVRRCVNPAHLFLGTYKDNHDDMAAKGRKASRTGVTGMTGELCPNTKLTDAQCAEIRAMREGGQTYRQIAAVYGVSKTQVSKICRGLSRALPTPKPEAA